MNHTTDRLLSKKEACGITGCSASYLDTLRRAGKLKTYRTLGGKFKFYLSDVIHHFNLKGTPQNAPQP